MPLLQSRLPHKRRHSDKVAVFESSEIYVAFGRVAKADRNCFNSGRAVLCNGFSECERLGFERLQPEPPLGCGIAFEQAAYLHSFSFPPVFPRGRLPGCPLALFGAPA